MTQARCFECNIGLPISGKSMEELLKLELPIFCSTDCSIRFPDNGTPEFIEKILDLKRIFKSKPLEKKENE